MATILYIDIYVHVSKVFHETAVVYFINVNLEYFLCEINLEIFKIVKVELYFIILRTKVKKQQSGYMAYEKVSRPSPSYELSLGTSLSKVGRLGAENN